MCEQYENWKSTSRVVEDVFQGDNEDQSPGFMFEDGSFIFLIDTADSL